MATSPSTKKRLVGFAFGFLIVVTASGAIMPQRAHAAGFPVVDIINEIKEWGTDTLAWQVGNLVIESLLKSTINWINSGFEGSPAYVTDLQENFRGLGDAVAEKFFQELVEGLDETDLPFQDRVIDAVRLGYYLHTSPESFYTKYPSTLNQVSPDSRAFLEGDFSQGGFNAWFATLMNPSNNPYGARDLAERYLSSAIGTQVELRTQELEWGKGFLSWRGKCTQQRSANDPVPLNETDSCLSYEIKTPGSVIVEQLNNTLGESTVSRLVSADELNEVISALLNQLVKQVLGGNEGGGGLAGASRPASGGNSFLDRTTSSSQPGSAVSNLISTFRTTITSQQAAIAAYRAGWEKIRGAAEQAEGKCPSATPNASEVRARANTALTKAANAEAAISELEADLDAALTQGGGQSQDFMSISDRYNELFSTGALVLANERLEAETESTDTGDERPGSLYSQLMRQASGSCDSQ